MKGERKKSRYLKACFFVALMMLIASSTTATLTSTHTHEFRDWSYTDQISIDYHEYYPTPPISIPITYMFSQPTITPVIIDDVIYHSVRMDDLPVDGAVNDPLLPVKPVNVLLPQRGEVVQVTTSYGSKISLGTGYNVERVGEPRYTALKGEGSQTQYHSSAYTPVNYADHHQWDDSVSPYPQPSPSLYTTVGTYDFRGYDIHSLVLHPIQFKESTGELYYYNEITVTVKCQLTGSVSPLFRGYIEDELLAEHAVDDASMMETYDTLPAQIEGGGLLGDPISSYKYVIITTEELRDATGDYTFQTLQDYKNDHGTPTAIISVESIESVYPGVDTPEKIRAFIKEVYQLWGVDYVLLGGDFDIIPARYLVTLFYDPGDDPTNDPIPSDLYYACLNGNFNHDGDEFYGEIGDINDYRAEVYVGRACVNTPEELARFVGKTITYETTVDPYLNKVLLVGEFLFHGDTVEIDGHVLTIPHQFGGDFMDQLIDDEWATGYYTQGIPSDLYTIDKLYDRDWPGFDPENPDTTGWPKAEVINRINDNVHIINHLGHGNNYHVMKLNEPVIMRGGDILGESHDIVGNLTNDKYCFIYSQACLPGAFDNMSVRGMWGPDEEPLFPVPYDCIGEYITTKIQQGAFAVIMNTRFGLAGMNISGIKPWGPSHHFNREFWDAVYRESEDAPILRELGPANQESKEDNIFRLINPAIKIPYFELTLFGDPQLALKNPEDYQPGWVSPTDYSDPDHEWAYEPRAYDQDTDTKAECTVSDYGWQWTSWLELEFPEEISCSKIRFNAWYSLLYCNLIDIDWTNNGGTWYCFCDEDGYYSDTYTYPNRNWKTLYFDSDHDPHDVLKVRVRFYVRRPLFQPVTADLYEVQFWQVS